MSDKGFHDFLRDGDENLPVPAEGYGFHAPEEEKPRSRRWLLKAAMLGAVGVIAEGTRQAGLWHEADLGIGQLAEERRKLTANREKFAESYLQNPDAAVDLSKAADLFVHTEAVRYGTLHRDFDIAEFRSTAYPLFMEEVRKRMQDKRMDERDVLETELPTVEAIVSAKLALHAALGDESHYWGEKNNIVDAVHTHDIQCRSGSRLLQLALLQNVQPQFGEKLVCIYSARHMQTGLLTADGRLIAFEMTKKGKGIQDLGMLKDLHRVVTIVDLGHDIAQAGLDQTAHEDRKHVVLENNTSTIRWSSDVSETPGFGSGKSQQRIGGGLEATTDRYNIGGQVEIPEGRLPLTSMNRVPTEFEMSGIGNHRNVYDTVRDGAADMPGLTPAEAQAIREFKQHSPLLLEMINDMYPCYMRLVRNTSENRFTDALHAKAQAQKIIAYMDQNNVDPVYAEFKKAFNAYVDRNRQNLAQASIMRDPRKIAEEVLINLPRLER